MPEPLSEAAAKRVEKLLREGKSAVEVSRLCIERWPLVTPARVRMEAYRLRIPLSPGRPVGTPGQRGPRGPGKKHSKLREPILKLYNNGKGLKPREIAVKLGCTPAAVYKIIGELPSDEKAPEKSTKVNI